MTDLVTVTPAQLPRLSAVSAEALTVVQEPDGPVAAVEIKTLFGRLIQTDTIKVDRATLYADVAHDAMSVALVYDDSTPAYNGWYRKSGASGTGGWTQFEKLSAQALAEVQAAIDAANASLTAKVTAANDASSAAQAAAARLSPFKVAPASGSPFAAMGTPQFLPSIGGQAITIPPGSYVRNIGRRSDGATRLVLAAMIGGVEVQWAGSTPTAAGQGIFDGSTLAGEQPVDMYVWNLAAGVPLGSWLGAIPYVFPAGGAATGNYGGTYGPDDGGKLEASRMQPSLAARRVVAELVGIELAIEAARNDGVFIAPVRDAKLRDRYQALKVIGGQHDRNRYIISSDAWTHDTLNGIWAARVTLRDVVDGYDMCQVFQNWTSDPTGLGVQPVLFYQGLLAANSGIVAAAMVDLSQAWTDAYVPRTFTTTLQSGIDPRNVLTTEELDSFLVQPVPVRSIRTGPGEGVSTATAATTSLYDLDPAPTTSSFPISSECTAATPVEILMAVNGTVENCSGLVTPPGLIIRGRGWAASALRNDTAGKRVLEATQTFAAIDLALLQFANEYIYHSDNFGFQSGVPSVGAAEQRWFIRQLFRRVLFYSGPAMQVWGAGMGLSPGMRAFWEDCLFVQASTTSTAAPIGIHNTPGGNQNGAIAHINRVTFRHANAACPSIQLLSSFGSSTRARVIVEGCTAQGIAGTCDFLADNDANMPRRARDRWAFDLQIIGGSNTGVDIVDPKMRVLTANAGTTIGGTAGPGTGWDIFGARYDVVSGKGEYLTLDGSIRALQATLGDRRSASKTLTFTRSGVSAETVTLSADYRGMSEGAILAAINAQLSNFVVGTTRIDGNLGVLS